MRYKSGKINQLQLAKLAKQENSTFRSLGRICHTPIEKNNNTHYELTAQQTIFIPMTVSV